MSTVHDILKKQHYRPYKPTIVQGLREGDFNRRPTFCSWYQGKCQENLNFQNNIVWTDETYATNCGKFNKHNRHYWATENPQLQEQRRLQVRFAKYLSSPFYPLNYFNIPTVRRNYYFFFFKVKGEGLFYLNRKPTN